jgi:poly-gamma-glutamate synthesis protein (capsule biosynthesis protein)
VATRGAPLAWRLAWWLVCWLAFAAACGPVVTAKTDPGVPPAAPPAPAPAPTGEAGAEVSAAPPDGGARTSDAGAAAARVGTGRLVLVAGGDLELARAMGQRLLSDPATDPLATLAPLLASGDVRFANLESQLSEQGGVTISRQNSLVFVGPPVGADALARARITVVSTANNHAWDFGRRAFVETLENLDRVGVRHVGTGRTRDEALSPVILEHEGHRLALLAVTDIWNQGPLAAHVARDLVADADRERLPRQVAELRRDVSLDSIVVSYHGGDEYQDAPTLRTRRLLRAVVDAGADAVLGHHVHVVQGIEWYRGKPILYSMGNLLMQAHRGVPATAYGYLARLTLARGGVPRLEVCPFRIVGLTPTPFVGVPGRDAFERTFFSRLRRVSWLVEERLQVAATGADGCAAVAPKSGPER